METEKKQEVFNFSSEHLYSLEHSLADGLSNREACFLADISEAWFYKVLKTRPDLVEKFEALKDSPKIKAKKNIKQKIDEGDVSISQWYLERRDPDFKPKQEFGFDKKYDNALSEVKGVILLASGKNYDSTAQLESPIQGRSAESVDTDTGPAGDFGDNTAPETS